MREKRANGSKQGRQNYLQDLQTWKIQFIFQNILVTVYQNGRFTPFTSAISIESPLAKHFHRSVQSFEVHLKWKLKEQPEQSAKDPPKTPCAQDCGENWIFLVRTRSPVYLWGRFLELYLMLLRMNPVFISAHAERRATCRSGLLYRNCSNFANW